MPLNKFRLKAIIFELLEPLQKLSAIDDDIANDFFLKIKKIKDADFEFVSQLLIKEIDYKNQKTASTLLAVAHKLCPKKFLEFILEELKSKRVKDEKKFFLINVLTSIGVNFHTGEIDSYLSNPKEAIHRETKRFLESAKTDCEAQIDFLDFYFSTSKDERIDLLTSVIEDFEDDELANILSLVMLGETDVENILFCLEELKQNKSLFLYRALKYLSFNKDKKVSQKASKMYRKLSMQGLFSKENLQNFYKNLLCELDEPVVRASIPDGNSNFSLVISRKSKNNAYTVLFIAINAEIGPFSCFGFSKITENDYNSIMERFFNDTFEQIYISPACAKTILEELTMRRISLNKNIPYEYFCWQRAIEDVISSEKKLFDMLKEGLKKVELNELKIKAAYGSKYIENWFFRYSKNNLSYSNFIKQVMLYNKNNVYEIEKLIETYSSDKLLSSLIKHRILFLAHFLKNNNQENLADIYYSIMLNESDLKAFLKEILKKSIYEHCLSSKIFMDAKGLILKKNSPLKYENTDLIIDYIEKNWVTKSGN